MATHFDYDCGNGIMWRIPLEDEKIERRKIRVRRPDLSEAQEAVQIMREFYAAKGIPVPQWEEEFGQKMIEAEGAPPPPEVPSSSESEKEEAIPPMPAYGTQEFFVWCKKTKKAREAIKAKKEAAKEAAKEEKEAAKAAALAAKTKKVAEPKPKMKPRIKVKDTPV